MESNSSEVSALSNSPNSLTAIIASKPMFAGTKAIASLLSDSESSEAPKGEETAEVKSEIPEKETLKNLNFEEKEDGEELLSKSEQGKEKQRQEGQKEVAAEAGDEEAPAKILKIKIADKEIDLPEDTIIETQVNGKPEKVKLSELQKNYSGKVAYDKKFSELDIAKKNFGKEKDTFQNNVKTVDEKLNWVFKDAHKNPLGTYEKLCRMAGLSTKEQIKTYIDQATKIAQEWAGYTPEQQAQVLEKKQLEIDREEVARDKADINASKESGEVNNYVLTLMNNYGVSEKEMHIGWNAVQGAATEGKLKIDDLSPKQLADLTIQFIQSHRFFSKIEEGINSVIPEGSKNGELVGTIASLVRGGYPKGDFSTSDVIEIVRGYEGVAEEPSQSDEDLEDSKPAPKKRATAKRAPEENEDSVIDRSEIRYRNRRDLLNDL